MTTRAQTEAYRQGALTHLLAVVLQFPDDSQVHKAFHGLGYEDIDDIVMMSTEEVMALQYKNDWNNKTEVKKDVPMKMKKKLIHALWWFDAESAKRVDGIVEYGAWYDLDEEIFERFRAQNASASRGGGKFQVQRKDDGDNVTSRAVERFRSGHK